MNEEKPSITRKYSVDEIDEMRILAERIYIEEQFARFCGGSIPSADTLEVRLRTYMMAGLGVAELEQRLEKLKAEDLQRMRERHESSEVGEV